MLVLGGAQPRVFLDEGVLAWSSAEQAFLLGRAAEMLRGHWSVLGRVGPTERQEIGELVIEQELLDSPPLFEEWWLGFGETIDRAGLLGCGDLHAALRVIARDTGFPLAPDDPLIQLEQMPNGVRLLRFYLSSEFDRLSAAVGGGAAVAEPLRA